MLLENNGILSSLKRTKPMNAKVFIKDKTKNGHIVVENCLTGRIWSNIRNKLKQGEAFRIFKRELNNFPNDYDGKFELNNTHSYIISEEVKLHQDQRFLGKSQKTW